MTAAACQSPNQARRHLRLPPRISGLKDKRRLVRHVGRSQDPHATEICNERAAHPPQRHADRDCGVSPMTTLLDWLRGPAGLKGTKEGCAEGDCGACTVVLEARTDGAHRAGDQCLHRPGGPDRRPRSAHGRRACAAADGALHPVQAAMVDADATQCGFCTPGFVMSAYAFAAGGETAGSRDASTMRWPAISAAAPAIAPIVEAMAGSRRSRRTGRTIAGHAGAATGAAPGSRRRATLRAPRTLAELLALRAQFPQALLLAGGTDLGLLASRARKPPAAVIHLAHVRRAAASSRTSDEATHIGAAVTYAAAHDRAGRGTSRRSRTYLARLGSRQIRNMGTIGGNIGTASPIGDMPPVLLALDARIRWSPPRGTRETAARRFLPRLSQDRARRRRGDRSRHAAQARRRRAFFCRQDEQAARPGYFHRLRGLSPAHRGREDRDVRLAFGGMAATPQAGSACRAGAEGRR